eukprot:1128267-Rhodomonas_salina.2
MGTPREEYRHLVEEYAGKAVPGGYRGFFDDNPADAAMAALPTFEGMMATYKLHELMHAGRTKETDGTDKARPDQSEDPANAFR